MHGQQFLCIGRVNRILHASARIGLPKQTMPAKRKASAIGRVARENTSTKKIKESPSEAGHIDTGIATASRRQQPVRKRSKILTDPDENSDVLDGDNALRASHDHGDGDEIGTPNGNGHGACSLQDARDKVVAKQPGPKKRGGKIDTRKPAKEEQAAPLSLQAKGLKSAVGLLQNPDAESDQEADEEEIKEASLRPPPVNSEYLPLPWKGRLGYACLNTYLRYSNPPVFSSRTCRIASILEHRHPLKDPSLPEHPTKNRPDKDRPADIARGQKWVQELGLANARDVIKMVRWNDKYGIKFMRLSSEMFPFASHEEYGYKLAPFASKTLADVGKVIAELGHRVTTHPGQFTQLGSPRRKVVDDAIRDLEYHDEMLTLLNLPEQQNRDAVMVLHMGGVFGDKAETLNRFRANYAKLSQSIKNRLVLENDDVGWSVHDLLPICKELNIPLVLDFHHHNIVFDKEKVREGTKDIMNLYPEIRETWTKKGITQKMHYSEPTSGAITARQRRKHSARVATLPPCPDDMDLMIEAKDKEQAVFELMRTFKLPGFDKIRDLVPYVRQDDNKNLGKRKSAPRGKRLINGEDVIEESAVAASDEELCVPEDEVGMGGPEGRVYWPPGMEEWLRPRKREAKKKDSGAASSAKNAKTLKNTSTKATKAAVEDELEELEPSEDLTTTCHNLRQTNDARGRGRSKKKPFEHCK
ncbi:UV damage endonuclease UvdE, variant [Verruconis gallopava]|uniref:UV damage endonuclease UvdE, variant n=1 Tax=Verruconis gallopava TaxID=253628 RepID=A0A0D2AIW9_9PEZI|nr:UV damage endonuclease UvdE, variant [Verruconis gallopava]KIW06480.1 UV damage endonuclease UvdE, variant [Verruconis gallopava]